MTVLLARRRREQRRLLIQACPRARLATGLLIAGQGRVWCGVSLYSNNHREQDSTGAGEYEYCEQNVRPRSPASGVSDEEQIDGPRFLHLVSSRVLPHTGAAVAKRVNQFAEPRREL
jgi:hypothetical protein